jgi:hypothetical protein
LWSRATGGGAADAGADGGAPPIGGGGGIADIAIAIIGADGGHARIIMLLGDAIRAWAPPTMRESHRRR